MKNENDDLLKFSVDKDGKVILTNGKAMLSGRYYNFSSSAGINYTVDVSKPAGDRITITSLSNGKPFDLIKKYTVAVNSYRGNGGGGHLIEGAKIPHDQLAGRIIHSTQKDLRYFLMKWIEAKKTVTPGTLNNWKVIPVKWWEKTKEKDYKLLFN
jgi:2',3'-cyclic-nucleotide 2'-phosphodiesterase/3'-nucleotidase